ncbi:MAG: DUF5050 domain-containing protein [Oscillospiraceae bacterium]|nr:DUF5050 domain-containing protein [Oscillospiraceae bacterium]
MKRIILSVAAVLMLFSTTALAESDISVTFDGGKIQFSENEQPRMINDRVMVPMRKIFDTIGAKVSWDAETGAVTAIKDAQYIKFTADTASMELGVCKGGIDTGELSWYNTKTLDSAPVIISDTMFVPARAVSEAFYYDVDWNADSKIVSLTTPTDAAGWIYYASWSDDGHMYKIDTNGQHRQKLSDNDCYLNWSFEYANDYIYYSIRDNENSEKEGCLYRIKTDGTGEEKLTDEPIYFVGLDDSGNIYFIDKGSDKSAYSYHSSGILKRIDNETGEISEILDKEVSEIELYKDFIYFQYADDTFDGMSYYRLDKNDGDIIKVTGDIPVHYLYIDEEDERLRFSSESYSSRATYTAALDGSDLKKKERVEREKDSLDYIRYRGDGFVVGTNYGENYLYGINEDGSERFKIEIPDPYNITGVELVDDRLFYSIHNFDYRDKIIYVDSIDELLGMNRISISPEKVDGKYEVNAGYEFVSLDSEEYGGIYSMNTDGTDRKKILDGYALISVTDDNRLVVYNCRDMNRGQPYTVDLDGGNLLEYEFKIEEQSNADSNPEETNIVNLNEDAKFGIVVYNDGTVTSYYNDRDGAYVAY